MAACAVKEILALTISSSFLMVSTATEVVRSSSCIASQASEKASPSSWAASQSDSLARKSISLSQKASSCTQVAMLCILAPKLVQITATSSACTPTLLSCCVLPIKQLEMMLFTIPIILDSYSVVQALQNSITVCFLMRQTRSQVSWSTFMSLLVTFSRLLLRYTLLEGIYTKQLPRPTQYRPEMYSGSQIVELQQFRKMPQRLIGTVSKESPNRTSPAVMRAQQTRLKMRQTLYFFCIIFKLADTRQLQLQFQ